MARTGGAPLPTITPDSALGGMVIERSLRFNGSDSAYLTRTPSSASNRRTFTFSCWVKRSDIGRGEYRSMFSARQSSTTNLDYFLWWNTDEVAFSNYNQTDYNVRTTQKFRDPNAWYHLVLSIDSTQGTAANRVKIYVNGSEVTDFGSSSYPSQNYDFQLNNNQPQYIGYNTFNYHDGYMTEINFVDGSQLDASYFGYTEFQTGIWRPKRYEGTYGTNGFYLDFSDNSSTTTLGIDKSPNGNDFTLNNFSVSAGIDNDSFTDTPTSKNVFAQLNSALPLASGAQYRNGNYAFYMTNNGAHMRASSNMSVNSGKWYAEFKLSSYTFASGSYPYIGVCADDLWINSWAGDTGTAYQTGGTIWRNGSSIESGHATYTEGDIISVAMNLDSSPPQVWWAKNGTYIRDASANPATGAYGVNIEPASATGYYNFAISLWAATGGQWDANFGQRAFSYDIPSGFKTLCTDNVRSTQNIRPQRHFDILTYTGDQTDGTRSITGLEFTPDFVWLKCRSSATSHNIYDSVRGFGANKEICSDKNQVEGGEAGSQYGYVNQNSKGFDLVAGSDSTLGSRVYNININSATYVAWCWKAGGAAVANSDGATASQVSVNTEAGFSIVTYTGTGSSTTIGHGLGKKPEMIFMKSRSATGDWAVLDKSNSTAEYTFYLNDNNAYGSSSGYTFYADTPPTSSVWTVNSASATNANGVNYVAYCWTSIPGYSKIGKYTGHGSADGSYVHVGFRPAWVLFKRIDYGGNWFIVDNKRDVDNECTRDLYPNTSGTETDNTNFVDFLSDGFKLRTTGTAVNAGTIVYMAFAEQSGETPFETFANAR